MKKAIALVLCLMMALSVIGMSAMAEGDVRDKVVIALSTTPTSFDPEVGDLITNKMVNECTHESLLGIDPATGEQNGEGAVRPVGGITKTDFYEFGLTGKPGSAAARDALGEKLGLPAGMTAPALLAAVNLLLDRDGLAALCGEEVPCGN